MWSTYIKECFKTAEALYCVTFCASFSVKKRVRSFTVSLNTSFFTQISQDKTGRQDVKKAFYTTISAHSNMFVNNNKYDKPHFFTHLVTVHKNEPQTGFI